MSIYYDIYFHVLDVSLFTLHFEVLFSFLYRVFSFTVTSSAVPSHNTELL